MPSRNVQRFRGGLVFKAHRLCVSLKSRLESYTEEEEEAHFAATGDFGGKVQINNFGTKLIDCYGFQPESLPDIRG